MATEEDVKSFIKTIPDQSEDTLVHIYKCCSSKQSAKDKKLYAPVMTAIEKERRKRGTASVISSKIVAPTTKKTEAGKANPDDY